LQFDLPLPREHGVFHHAGTARNWRSSVGLRGRKPTRVEALKYYRKAAEHYALELRLYERVLQVDGHDGNFTVVTRTEKGTGHKYQSKKLPWRRLLRSAEPTWRAGRRSSARVALLHGAYEYWNQDVIVIGGKNSAAEAALDLYRNGARVTLVHRKKELGGNNQVLGTPGH